MKIKVSESTPAQLNWLVAKCRGLSPQIGVYNRVMVTAKALGLETSGWIWYHPTIDPWEADLVIDQDKINTMYLNGEWVAASPLGKGIGETRLLAAMRCYVDSRLGDEVDIPEELV